MMSGMVFSNYRIGMTGSEGTEIKVTLDFDQIRYLKSNTLLY
jgi:hypothetical protein